MLQKEFTTTVQKKQVCIFCGEPAAEDCSTAVGEPMCRYCYDHSYQCNACSRTILDEDAVYSEYRGYYCQDCYEQLFVSCDECGDEILKEYAVHTEDGHTLCTDCYADLYVACVECDDKFRIDDMVAVNDYGDYVCQDCFDEYYYTCDHCDSPVHRDRAICDDNIALCEYCYEHYYVFCERCEQLVHVDNAVYVDDYPYCEYCGPVVEAARIIHYYDYAPSTLYFDGCHYPKDGVLYLGIELEVDEGGKDKDHAAQVIDILGDEYVYIKADGSLNDGFEIVTHPSTLSYHKTQPWADVFEYLRCHGYKSHDAETCGLHIHITRAVFSEAAEGRLLYLVEKFWPQLVKFSRRTEEQLDRWATRYGLDDGETPEDLRAKARGCGRYYAVNLTNYSTIELRLFRGTLKLETFFATLEFAEYLAKTAISSTNEDVQRLTWEEFVKDVPEDYTYLRQYLVNRGLA